MAIKMFAGNILMGNILISSLSVNLFYFFFLSVENLWLKKKNIILFILETLDRQGPSERWVSHPHLIIPYVN